MVCSAKGGKMPMKPKGGHMMPDMPMKGKGGGKKGK